MGDGCKKKENCMNIWSPCKMNCMSMCSMKMYPVMPMMQPQMHKCSMMKYPMACSMMMCPGMQPIMNQMIQCPTMMPPMVSTMNNPIMGQNIGYMNNVMRAYEDIDEDEYELPYVTMREVKIQDIQE